MAESKLVKFGEDTWVVSDKVVVIYRSPTSDPDKFHVTLGLLGDRVVAAMLSEWGFNKLVMDLEHTKGGS